MVLHGLLKKMIPRSCRPAQVLRDRVERATRGVIPRGPFRGMKLLDAPGELGCSGLLGTYEQELHEVVEQICSREWKRVIDIGGGFGYYVVGLARRLPAAEVISYEADESLWPRIDQLARQNAVRQRVELRGMCTSEELSQSLGDNSAGETLVICDIEGGEGQVLDPEKIPALQTTSILVELHEFMVEGVDELIIERFHQTHRLQRIWSVPRTRDDLMYAPWYFRWLPERYAVYPLDELRPVQMSWLWMEPQR